MSATSSTVSESPRVAVVGPGSVGLVFAALLAASGRDVVACARRPFDRYVIESDTIPLDIDARVETDPAAIDGPVDWVLFCVKAHQSQGAAGWLERLCDHNTRVAVVQNGIEHDRIAPWVSGATVIPSVVYCGAELIEPGRVRHLSHNHLFVPAESGDELVELFHGSAAQIRPTDNFATEQWRKLSINVVANGLTALTNRELDVLADPAMRDTVEALLRECWTVAAADGADLDPRDAGDRAAKMAASHPQGGTSMLYDTRAGRLTEHDAIHGAALRRGAAHDIDMPTVATLHALLQARAGASSG